MQIIVKFENEVTCICQSLQDTVLRIMLSCFFFGRMEIDMEVVALLHVPVRTFDK